MFKIRNSTSINQRLARLRSKDHHLPRAKEDEATIDKEEKNKTITYIYITLWAHGFHAFHNASC